MNHLQSDKVADDVVEVAEKAAEKAAEEAAEEAAEKAAEKAAEEAAEEAADNLNVGQWIYPLRRASADSADQENLNQKRNPIDDAPCHPYSNKRKDLIRMTT